MARYATAAAVAAVMVVFALYAHRGVPWGVLSGAGLLAASAIIGWSLRTVPHPLGLLGLGGAGRHVPLLALLGIALGVGAGLAQRAQPGVLPAGSAGLQPFVVVACLIGAMEELVYRGWLLGRLAALGWPASVVLTAVAHAAYKTALFVWPPSGVHAGVDLVRIALWTTAGGVVLGGLRASSRSVVPAVAAHVAFDAVVYSAFAAAPWWVWG